MNGRSEFQLTNIGELFEQAIALTRPRWKDIPHQRGDVIHIKKELEEKLPHIMGSESDLREALIVTVINLV